MAAGQVLRFAFAIPIGAAFAAPLLFAGAAVMTATAQPVPANLTETTYSRVDGWETEDFLAALDSFRRFCRKPEAIASGHPLVAGIDSRIDDICTSAEDTGDDGAGAQRFFENHFTPYEVSSSGFVTGYFEPELPASPARTGTYATPLLKAPPGLVEVSDTDRPADWPMDVSHGRLTENGMAELPDRGAIMDGALGEEDLELVWLADPVDAFFVHVQGSARLKLTDGSVMRVGYAGKTGHPYTSIGRILVNQGEGTAEDFTMSGLKNWLTTNPHRQDALFRQNRSYIFFREITDIDPSTGPVGAAGIPLVPGRSLAIDPGHIPYGVPVFVEAPFPDPERPDKPFRRLMIADDTGSAIRGPARGDIFAGSGEPAGRWAGEIRHQARFTILIPKSSQEAAGHQD